METLQVTTHKDYAVVKLNRGRANPMNWQMVKDLKQAFQDLAADDAVRGVVLTGGEGYFSVGLDVVELYSHDEAAFEAFWRDFISLAEQLFAFPKALVAAITGHSPAGGCVLALCCDYRIMAEGAYTIGLNELAVGVVVPEPIFALLGDATGRDKAYQFILEAALLSPQAAREANMVHEICPMAEVMDRAVRRLRKWFVFDDSAWRQTKFNLRRALRETFNQDFDVLHGETVRHWWSPDTRARIENLVNLLKMKRG